MTFGEIQTDVKVDVGLTASPPTPVAARIKRNINKAHRMVLRDPGLSRLRDTLEPLSFASEANLAIYGLPAAISVPRCLTERDTDRQLDPMTLTEYRRMDPGLTASSATPWAFVPLGIRQVKRVPTQATGSGLWIASADAADVGQVATINGIRLGGLQTGDVTAALNGVTRVQFGALTDYVDIQSISLASVAVGIVSIFDAAVAGNTLAQIPIGATSPQYFVIQLVPTPSAVITYYVDGTLRGLEMDDDNEVPLLPEEFHDILADYARAREYEKMGDQRLAGALQMFNEGMNRLRYYVSCLPAPAPTLGGGSNRQYSRYGPNFPADSW
jgi:hypothetical protein